MAVLYHICPNCLNPVICYSKDYLEGEVRSVKVDLENSDCHVLMGSNIYEDASCSGVQQLKTHAGRIAKQLNLEDSKKNEFLNKVVELRKVNRYWKDYKVLEVALNAVLQGDVK
jgi:hypothetical protein